MSALGLPVQLTDEQGFAFECMICGRGSGAAQPWAATTILDGQEYAVCSRCVDPARLVESIEDRARECEARAERLADDLRNRAAEWRHRAVSCEWHAEPGEAD